MPIPAAKRAARRAAAKKAAQWQAEVLPAAIERLVPFLERKLIQLERLAAVEVLAGDDGPELGVGPARLTFRIFPALGPLAGDRLEVLAAVASDQPDLVLGWLAEAPLEEASGVWVQQVALRFLSRLAPHLPPLPQALA